MYNAGPQPSTLNHKVFIISEKDGTMLSIQTDPRVYGPEEDTYLLLEALTGEELSGRGLEIGTGTGIVALNVCHHFKTFTGTDINPHAVALAAKNAESNNIKNVHFHYSNLFSHLSGQFDVIIFNPPYVSVDEPITNVEDLSYHGGEDGRRTTDAFLRQFHSYLTSHGKVYLLQSSLSGIEKTVQFLEQNIYIPTILTRKRLFFEELVVFRITKGESP